jgi:hypothetical protein
MSVGDFELRVIPSVRQTRNLTVERLLREGRSRQSQ